ncbi:MAG: DUF4783 domain-containing protein [Sphingobacteriales bacterium]|nr:MAG: DUF4783 domain-containing protein [Sphingobacteriales bacterium]
MKNFTLALGLFLAFVFALAHQANAQTEVISSVNAALKIGSSKELARYFNNMVELGFDGNKSGYSQTQAEFVMKDFFAKNPPTNFEIIHQGASKEGLRYAIGKYTHKNGTFRVYMLIKQTKGNYQIDTIDFTRE